MSLRQQDITAGRIGNGRTAVPVLILTATSLQLGRRIGPLAWMTLQYLALSSHRVERGWAAAVGVRDVAAATGVTKDTAARAISTLTAAGLVTRDRVDKPGGGCRSGYLLRLPESIELLDRPGRRDPAGDRPAGGADRAFTPPTIGSRECSPDLDDRPPPAGAEDRPPANRALRLSRDRPAPLQTESQPELPLTLTAGEPK